MRGQNDIPGRPDTNFTYSNESETDLLDESDEKRSSAEELTARIVLPGRIDLDKETLKDFLKIGDTTDPPLTPD